VAIMPGALWRPLPYSSSPMTQYDILCYHTMVGSLWGTDAYFRRGSGVNSHFGVGYDGTIVQWVDTRYRSGANYNGNWHIVSVETADVGTGFPAWDLNDGSQVPAWTDAQVEANAAIATWVHETHGIPPVPIPDSKVGRRGVGWHRLGVDPDRVAGGELWSSHYGKVCPGSRRLAQIAEVCARAAGSYEEDPLATYTEDDLTRIIQNAVAGTVVKASPGGIGPARLDTSLGRLLDDANAAKERAGEAQRTGGVLLGTRGPASDAERAALTKLWGSAPVQVDEDAIAAAVASALPGLISKLSQEDLQAVATATADEFARRAQD
jgi:hypothetical protein